MKEIRFSNVLNAASELASLFLVSVLSRKRFDDHAARDGTAV